LFVARERSHSLARTGFAAGLVLIVALLAVAAHAAPVSDAPSASQRAHRGAAVQADDHLERQLLRALNQLRAKSGLRRLRLSRSLAAAAAAHSKSMARYGYFSHSSADGSRFWERVVRFYGSPEGWSVYIVGENLIRGGTSLSADDVMKGWLESRPHRKNLYGPWGEVGFGAVLAAAAPGVYEGEDVAIVTADFGVRR
jgi:uncharacterized protein YkwD